MFGLTSLQIVLVMAITSLIFILVALIEAYRAGRDRGLGIRSERFDRLYSELNLDQSQWRIGDANDDAASNPFGTVFFTQWGSRLRAEGVDRTQCPWSAEGVVFRRGAHLIFTERRGGTTFVGSLHLRLNDAGDELTGMLSVWKGDQAGGSIRTVTWYRIPTSSDTSVNDVDSAKHRLTTVANSPQRSNVFRPVDTTESELVAVCETSMNNDLGPHNR